MMAQMAATAGSVAVGSTIGHGISSMLFGGGGSAAAAEAQAPPVQQQQYQSNMSCEVQAKGMRSTASLCSSLTNHPLTQISPSAWRRPTYLLAHGTLSN